MYGLKSLCSWAWWSQLGLAIPEGLPGMCIQFPLEVEDAVVNIHPSPHDHGEELKA